MIENSKKLPLSLPATTIDEAFSGEIYRRIFVALDLPQDVRPAVIGVTSAISGEGRTTVAVGLARTLAGDLGSTVLLVEADFDRPSLALQFGIAAAPGLAEVVRGEHRLEDVLRPVPENLWVVPSGTSEDDADNLLRQLPHADLFRRMQPAPAAVIIDLPPVMNESYAVFGAQAADAVVLVVRAGVTPIDMVREAIARLDDQPPHGIVFNAFRPTEAALHPGKLLRRLGLRR